MSSSFFKQRNSKLPIRLHRNRLQSYTDGTLVERLGRRIEHIAHHVTLAAREDELCTMALLNLRAEQRFHISLSIFAYLLKLINGNDTWQVSLFDVCKDLIQCCLGSLYVAKSQVKRRGSCHAVQLETHPEG